MERARTRPAVVTVALLLWLPSTVAADPLDEVTGTEGWDRRTPENATDEWDAWLGARVRWREARQEARIQRMRNLRLASVLHASRGRPNFGYIRKVMRSRNLGTARPVPVRRPARPSHAEKPTRFRGLVPPGSEGAAAPVRPPRRRGAVARDATPEPPPWVRVPVEHLDSSGQAVDPEGDRVLRDATQKE